LAVRANVARDGQKDRRGGGQQARETYMVQTLIPEKIFKNEISEKRKIKKTKI
jgi:hypothetical protein